MKTYFVSIFASVAIVALCLSTGCTKNSPVAAPCITAMADTAVVGDNVIFASCTVGASSYIWAFGDGTSASTVTATHVYNTPGTYSGTLTVVASNGQSSTKSFTIRVVNPANPAGSWTIKGTNYLPVTVTGVTSQGIAELRAVNFSSGTSTSIELDLLFSNNLPTVSGIYTVVNGNSLPGTNQVSIGLSTASDYFMSTGAGSQTVNITVAAGKVSAAGTAIQMVNYNNSSDITPVTFNIHQQ